MDPAAQADLTLVEQAQAGDQAARRALWRGHRRWVAAIVIAHRPRTIDVEDLMQDVAVKFLDKVHTLRDPAAFRPWLRRVVINVCRGAARQQRPTLALAGSSQRHDDDGPGGPVAESHEQGPARQTSDRDAAEVVYRHALGLPPEYREPLLLRCMRGLTYRQISDLLDLPVTTIETRLARARRMIRTEMEEAVAEDTDDATG